MKVRTTFLPNGSYLSLFLCFFFISVYLCSSVDYFA
jgi:hypothetical protein